MKTIILLALLSGCADMSPRQIHYTQIAIGVLAVGAIAVYSEDHGSTNDQKTTQPVNCSVTSCQ